MHSIARAFSLRSRATDRWADCPNSRAQGKSQGGLSDASRPRFIPRVPIEPSPETRADRDVKHAPDIGKGSFAQSRQSRGPAARGKASSSIAQRPPLFLSLSPKGRGHRPDRDLATAPRTNVHVHTHTTSILPRPSGQFVRSTHTQPTR